MRLFYTNDPEAIRLCGLHCGYRIRKVLPGHCFGGAQCSFVNIAVRRGRCVSAKPECLCQEGVAGAEGGSYVMHAPYIIEYNDDRSPGGVRSFRSGLAAKLFHRLFYKHAAR